MGLDHEKLDVYRLELELVRWTTGLLAEIRSSRDGVNAREVCDHLDRASLSALFNTAEGNGKRQRQTRSKFFDDARGSATECSACLDALVAKGVCPSHRISEGKDMLVRIVSMLCKMVDMYSAAPGVHEEGEAYETEAV